MSQITDAFSELVGAQTEAAVAVFADFNSAEVPGTSASVVVGNANYDDALFGGGIGDRGTVQIQLLVQELQAFSYTPEKTHTVVLSTDNREREITEISESHGVYTITLGDYAVK